MNNKEELKAKIQKQIVKKYVEQLGYYFVPYTNRDGSESWQQKLEKLLKEEKMVQEIFLPCANSSGKSQMLAYIALSVLNGTHPLCERFKHRNSIHIHIICEDKGVIKNTMQVKFEEMTNGELTARGFANKERYKITSHNEVFNTITHRGTTNFITFGSTKEGATGLVGIRPQILLCDEPVSETIYNELAVRATEEGSIFIQAATVIDTKHAWLINKCKEILENPTPSRRVITARMLDNPFVPEAKLEHLKEVYGEDSPQYKARVLGELILVDGLVLNGIEKVVVPNNYIPEEYINSTTPYRNYIWVESWDFGVGKTDPTLIGFFKCYSNGLIVQEDELCLYEKTLDDWVEACLKKRFELDMDYYVYGNRQNGAYIDPILGIEVRKPTICVGDKSYLARKAGVNTPSRIKSEFAKRNIFIQPASGDRVENGIPVIQTLIKNKVLLIKERCHNCINMAKNWVVKVSDRDGKPSYNSPYDHYGDILRYMIEKIPSNTYVAQIKANEEFLKSSKTNTVKDRLKQEKLKYNF